jgi:small subunit ribosomal protein S18
MAMKPTARKGKPGAKKTFRKRNDGPEGFEGAEGVVGEDGKVMPRLYGRPYFQRKKSCPFSGPKAPKIDYKDVKLLTRYISDYGKIIPAHVTGVCNKKQRELSQAIKRARQIALIPYTSRGF